MRGALAIAWVVALGACQTLIGIDDYPETLGTPCSINAVCADGQVCDFSSSEGPLCVQDGGDTDGDGIPDAQDHCLRIAGGAHDEDGDGAGDECDRCPIAPPPAQPDGDTDGVDHPCDPKPMLTGERIALFDAFNGDKLAAAWRPTTPALWQVSDGALHYNGKALGPEELIEVSVQMSSQVSFQSSYRVVAVEDASTRHRVVMGAKDPAPNAGSARFACVTERMDGYADEVIVESSGGYDSMPPINGTDVFSPDATHRIGGLREGASVSCVFLEGTIGAGTAQAAIGAGQLGTAWLGAQATTVEFDWILVVVR